MIKLIFIISFLVCFIYLQYFLGTLNPRSIKINNMKIDTPNMYYINNGMKNFKQLNIDCTKKPWCNKKFILNDKKDNNTYENITIYYKKILSSNTIVLSFTEIGNKPFNKFINQFFNKRTTENIGRCIVSKEYIEDIYNYSIQLNKNLFIQIYANEKIIIEMYLKQFCN